MNRKSRKRHNTEKPEASVVPEQTGSRETPKPEVTPVKRAIIWVGGIITALVAATATAFGTGLGQNAITSVGKHPSPHHSPTPSPFPSVGQLAITQGSSYYQFISPVFNPEQKDQQIRQIDIDVRWQDTSNCAGTAANTYKVGDALLMYEKGKVVGSVVPQSGAAAGSAVNAVGSFHQDCGKLDDLTLEFTPPALILTRDTTSVISVSLPLELQVLNSSLGTIVIPSFISDGQPRPLYGTFRAEVSFQLNSEKLDSCGPSFTGNISNSVVEPGMECP